MRVGYCQSHVIGVEDRDLGNLNREGKVARVILAEVIVDGEDEDIPGHRHLDGTHIELGYDVVGDDLMLRVNKGPVLIFRVRPKDAFKEMSDADLSNFNTVAPDFIFQIGDSRERMYQLAKGLGLPDDELERLKTALLE